MIQELQQEYNSRNEVVFDIENPQKCMTTIFKYLIDCLDENRVMVRTVMKSNAKNIVLDILSEQLTFDLKKSFCYNKTKQRGKYIPAGNDGCDFYRRCDQLRSVVDHKQQSHL